MRWTTAIGNHGSPLSGEETNSKENTVGSGVLKKGPWTPEEDAILTDYVQKHGPGNWNVVQKFSGLSRCGKSCRLRWANHLRSDLKKGPITPEEEVIILRHHAMHGNKWSLIAAEVCI